MFFKFTVDPQIVEANDINDAHSQYCMRHWFPGIIYAQEVDPMGNPIGDKTNLRIPTNEGVEFETTRAKNRQGYAAACINQLVRTLEQLGVEQFTYKPDDDGDADITFKLNERGVIFAEKLKSEKGE